MMGSPTHFRESVLSNSYFQSTLLKTDSVDIHVTARYLHALLWGVLCSVRFVPGIIQHIGTKVVLIVNIIGSLFNVILNWFKLIDIARLETFLMLFLKTNICVYKAVIPTIKHPIFPHIFDRAVSMLAREPLALIQSVS